jgi:hypothetical protein
MQNLGFLRHGFLLNKISGWPDNLNCPQSHKGADIKLFLLLCLPGYLVNCRFWVQRYKKRARYSASPLEFLMAFTYLFLLTTFSTTAFLAHNDHLPSFYNIFYAKSDFHFNSNVRDFCYFTVSRFYLFRHVRVSNDLVC